MLATVALPSGAEPAVKQVLMLQSLDRGNVILDHFTGDFRVSLDQRAGGPVNVVQVVVGPTGFVGAPEQAVVEYIRAMYAGRSPDLIMAVAGPAAVFARRHREELFPRTPLLFAAVDQRYLGSAPLGENESAVVVANDFPRLIDDILRVLPETRQVFMVIGSGAIGRFWRRELDAAFARFRDRVAFIWSEDLSLDDTLRRCASLPPHSAIVYITFGTDAQGGAYADEQVLASLHARANAPMFGAISPLFGSGIVGGSMMSIDDLARRTAEVANRILNGEPAGDLRGPAQLPGRPLFDWRELRRWGIPESRLPPRSIVRFRAPSLWDEYRLPVLGTLGVLLLQSLMIAWLLYERRARQRAEIESRRNLALAADANRRESISALTASIGHELGQPLTSILHNAEALKMMVAGNGAAPAATQEVLVDIHAGAALAKKIIERHRTMLRSHELSRKPIDLHSVVRESLGLVAHEMRAHRIEVTVELSPTPCIIDGDAVLLEQVLVNLVRNAIDAMSGMPPAKRRIAIRTAVEAGGVELSVRDAGTGLDAEAMRTLFTPFTTTKPNGLGIGLVIAQRIVDAHGGAIAARSNADGGATFTITLPRSAAPFTAAAEAD